MVIGTKITSKKIAALMKDDFSLAHSKLKVVPVMRKKETLALFKKILTNCVNFEKIWLLGTIYNCQSTVIPPICTLVFALCWYSKK